MAAALRRLVYALRVLSETHTAHHADPRYHRPDASRRLRRHGREGRAVVLAAPVSGDPHVPRRERRQRLVQGDAASSVRTIYLHGSVP